MKADPPAAALRLMAALPCRTHYAPTRAELLSQAERDNARVRSIAREYKTVGNRNGPKGREVRIGGRPYASMNEAIRALRISNTTFYRMLADGRALRA